MSVVQWWGRHNHFSLFIHPSGVGRAARQTLEVDPHIFETDPEIRILFERKSSTRALRLTTIDANANATAGPP
jgi:hypothetical protein